jgi:hypothetical protein
MELTEMSDRSVIEKQLTVFLNQGEVGMSKEETHIGDINMSNIGGQVFLRRFNDVVANLSSGDKNRTEISNALSSAKDAVTARKMLSEEQKQKQIEVLSQIGEQVAKLKPNKTLIKGLGEGLTSAVESIPDVAKAARSVAELLGKFNS